MKGDFESVGLELACELPDIVLLLSWDLFNGLLIFPHQLPNNLVQQHCANSSVALGHTRSCLSRLIFLCFSPVRVVFDKVNGFLLTPLSADLRLLLLYLEPEKLTVLL